MRNVLAFLVQAYYTIILAEAIRLDGKRLPVYDGMAPDSETGSYILISPDRTAVQVADKCTFAFNASILVDVVVKNGSFSLLDSDNIADVIAAAISTWRNPDVAYFQVVKTEATFSNLTGLNPTEPVFRTLIRYNHFIVQK